MAVEKTIIITRFDPDKDEAPRKQEYTVPCEPNWKVLDAVNFIKDELDAHNWWSLYKLLFIETDWDEVYYTKPLTVEYLGAAHFIWEKNPWELETEEMDVLELKILMVTVLYTVKLITQQQKLIML